MGNSTSKTGEKRGFWATIFRLHNGPVVVAAAKAREEDEDASPLLGKREEEIDIKSAIEELVDEKKELLRKQNLWTQHLKLKREDLTVFMKEMGGMKSIALKKLQYIKEIEGHVMKLETALMAIDKCIFLQDSIELDGIQINILKKTTAILRSVLNDMENVDTIEEREEEFQETMQEVKDIQRAVGHATKDATKTRAYDADALEIELNQMFSIDPIPTRQTKSIRPMKVSDPGQVTSSKQGKTPMKL